MPEFKAGDCVSLGPSGRVMYVQTVSGDDVCVAWRSKGRMVKDTLKAASLTLRPKRRGSVGVKRFSS